MVKPSAGNSAGRSSRGLRVLIASVALGFVAASALWAARPFTTTSAVAVSDTPAGLVRDVIIRTDCAAAMFAGAEDRAPEPASFADGTEYSGVVDASGACADQRRQQRALLAVNTTIAAVTIFTTRRIGSDS